MRKLLYFLTLSVITMVSCSPADGDGKAENAAKGRDFKAPVLESVASVDQSTVCLTFDENVIAYENSFENCTAQEQGCFLFVQMNNSLPPGKSCYVKGRVSDLFGNTTGFKVLVWGINSNPCGMRINEFTTKGTASNPDRTELYVYSSGSTAGFCLYDGIPSDYRSYVVLDDINVSSGTYIVIWWTESLPDGVQRHPSEYVYNICAKSKTNLSENNGILTLTYSPSEGSEVAHCIAYSSKDSAEYGGYGTKEVYERVKTAQSKGYLITDTVNSKNSTSTRSIAYNSLENRWYITATSSSTFGSENTSAEYSY